MIWPRREGVEYSVDHAILGGEDWFAILHNDGAEDFELVRVPASAPNPLPPSSRRTARACA